MNSFLNKQPRYKTSRNNFSPQKYQFGIVSRQTIPYKNKKKTISFKKSTLPVTSTNHFLIQNITKEKIISYRNLSQKHQISSLSKLFTCLCVFKLIKQFKLSMQILFIRDLLILIPEKVMKMGGTIADLIENTWISLQDLIYGLMVLSGKNVENILGILLGILLEHKTNHKDINQLITTSCNLYKCIKIQKLFKQQKLSLSFFINYMNHQAKTIGLRQSIFYNTHGKTNNMQTIINRSTCTDLLVISKLLLKYPIFRNIIATKYHKAKFYSNPSMEVYQKQWINTNIMLFEGFKGIKIDQDKQAGGCLISLLEHNNQQYLFIILGSNIKHDLLFQDIRILKNWFVTTK